MVATVSDDRFADRFSLGQRRLRVRYIAAKHRVAPTAKERLFDSGASVLRPFVGRPRIASTFFCVSFCVSLMSKAIVLRSLTYR